MGWISRWNEQRHMRELKRKVAKLKMHLAEVQVDLGMPTLETISRRIAQERIILLERAVETLESQHRTLNK